jgi:hypothetical protein
MVGGTVNKDTHRYIIQRMSNFVEMLCDWWVCFVFNNVSSVFNETVAESSLGFADVYFGTWKALDDVHNIERRPAYVNGS